MRVRVCACIRLYASTHIWGYSCILYAYREICDENNGHLYILVNRICVLFLQLWVTRRTRVPPTPCILPSQKGAHTHARPGAEVIYFMTLRIIHKTFISEFMNLAGNSRGVLLCAAALAYEYVCVCVCECVCTFDHAAFMCCIIDHNDSRILPICWRTCASAYYLVECVRDPVPAVCSCKCLCWSPVAIGNTGMVMSEEFL